MNAPDYESIWQQSLIRVTDKFSLPPIVLRVDDAVIGTLGNFSVSTGKAKAKRSPLPSLMDRYWNIGRAFPRASETSST